MAKIRNLYRIGCRALKKMTTMVANRKSRCNFVGHQTPNHEPRNQNQTQSRPCDELHRADRLPRHRILRQIHPCNYHQLNPKTMHKFEVTNWSQYMRASEHLGYFSSLDSAIGYCKHQTPHGADAQSWEEYSEVTELDPHGNPVETHYFVTL